MPKCAMNPPTASPRRITAIASLSRTLHASFHCKYSKGSIRVYDIYHMCACVVGVRYIGDSTKQITMQLLYAILHPGISYSGKMRESRRRVEVHIIHLAVSGDVVLQV